ncbi:hypothetical protein QGP82_13805 [Leptothoe sp. LEGE 181152]|nr:hypothetical protein [Leptothoe sp. LEGE 181152]
MSSSLTKQTTVSFGFVAELTAGGETVNLQLENTQEGGTSVFRGGMLPGQRLLLVALLQKIIPELPPLDSMSGLAITELTLEARPTLETYAFSLGLADVWAVEIPTNDPSAPLNFSIDRILIALKQSPQEKSFFLQGDFSLFGGQFSVLVSRIVTTATSSGEWIFLARAERIQLASLVNKLLGAGNLTSDFELENLSIDLLELELAQKKVGTITQSRYRFLGAIDWAFTIASEPFVVRASAEIKNYREDVRAGKTVKTITDKASGKVAGLIELFDKTLTASIFYEFSLTEKRVGFEITFKSFTLTGRYSNTNNIEKIDFSFSGIVNIGDIISYVVNLFDPSLEDFELDAPWDVLGKESIDFSKLRVSINLTNKQFTFSYAESLNLGLFKISNLNLSYDETSRGSKQYRSRISLDLTIPGQPRQQVGWDPVNENPPNIPGKGIQVFDLQFLAVGQRVTFHPAIVSQARNITQVMTVLRQTMGVLPPAKRRGNPLLALQAQLPSPAPVSIDPTATITIPEGSSPIQFDPNSGILLGAQFSIMDTIDMSVIFNDPLIYGLRISLYGAKAKLFAGLQFEILYRRVSDTVGVYHLELALPDAMRQFDVGAVSVTLPIVVVDIYTNGDFALDFGFPWKGDFSRSFAIQGFAGPFPVLGAGGFYFAKLSAETATSTPAIVNGTFSPVYEFGLGLKIGLGRTFNKGILKAEISITVQGVIQGVVARFNPSEANVASDDYFKIQGGVSLVGRLYGVVDFGVISVDVEVVLRATVLFVVEAYQPTQLALEAEVSVRASIKIAFVRIRFSFRVTVRQSFTLGSAKPTPWKLGSPPTSSTNAIGATSRRAARFAPAAFSMPVAFETAAFEAAAFEAIEPTTVEPPDFTTLDVSALSVESAPASTVPDALVSESVVSAAVEAELSFTTLDADTSGADTAETWLPVKLSLPDGLPADQIDRDRIRIDLYFQPGFTQVGGQVKGVALLFIENSVRHDDPEQIGDAAATVNTDFDELVKALLRWTLHSYRRISSTDQPLTLVDWQTLYDRFTTEFATANNLPAFLRQLYQFLETNFVFDISDRMLNDLQQNQELSGTFFPMVPLISMALDQQSPIDFQVDSFKRSLDDLQKIKDYFKQLQVRPGSAVENSAIGGSPSDLVTSGTDLLSLTDYLFADYFLLLIRSGLQSAIDYLEDLEDQTAFAAPSIETVLSTLNSNGAFNHLSGTASRYFLHGLRLPTPTAAPMTAWATNPLYEATGQQFDVSITTQTVGVGDDAREVTTVNLDQIVLSKPATLNWIRFIDYDRANLNNPPTRNAASLVYGLTTEQKNDLLALQTATPNLDHQSTTPPLLPFYRSVERQYTLRQRSPMTVGELRELPSDLRAYLADPLTYRQGLLPDSAPLSTIPFILADATDKTATPLPRDRVKWSTKVKVTVRRLAGDNIYQLEGTDEVGKDLLEAIRVTGASPSLDLFYLDADTAQLVQPTRDVLLLKANLSTRSQAAGTSSTARSFSTASTRTTYQATLPANSDSDGADFLQILWECSTVNSGGYYLVYGPLGAAGLPENLFTDGVTADLVLVIRVTGFTQEAARFHNCVDITAAQSVDLLAIRNDEHDPIPVLQIPAGHLGIQLTRPNVSVQPNNGTANDELENLYQLLGYRLLEQPGQFVATPEALPIGPSDDPEDANHPWQYERVLPVYTLSTDQGGTANPSLPSPEMNPYRGVSAQAVVQPQLEWRDLYGNIFKQFKFTELPVRYFDPLLGLNQWPSLVERYRFKAVSQQKARLDLSLQLDSSPYISTPGNLFEEVRRKTIAARETYQQIYYQIHQADVTATAATSVLLQGTNVVQKSVDKAVLTSFVEMAYGYLITLESLTLQSHNVSANETFATVANTFRLSVDDLAEENQQLSGLWTAGTRLEIPVERDIVVNDSLRKIAQEALKAEALLRDFDNVIEIATAPLPNITEAATAAKVVQIAQRHRDTPGLVRDGLSISSQANTYETLPGDTLAEIAGALGITVEALIPILEAKGDYLDDQVILAVPLTYDWRSTDSLAHARDKVQAVFKNTTLNIGLDAELLTVTDIALATNAFFGTTTTLTIPAQLTFAPNASVSTSGSITEPTLDAVVRNLQPSPSTHRQIDLAAFVTTNQTLSGLIQPGQSLLPAFQSWSVLVENTTPELQTYVQPFLNAALQPFHSQSNVPVTRDHETFHSLTQLFEQVRVSLVAALASAPDPANAQLKTQVQQLRERLDRTVSLAEVAIAIQTLPILQIGAPFIKPPYIQQIPITLDLPTDNNTVIYPEKLIFPVTVNVTLQRDDNLVANDLPDRTLVQRSTAYLSPHTINGDTRSASLQGFAQDFQAAFSGLRLATSDNRNPGFPGDPNNASSQSIWAVRLGQGGLTYTIQPLNLDQQTLPAGEDRNPLFFAPAPLANTLMAGTVDLKISTEADRNRADYQPDNKRFDAIDLNLLGQSCLQAVEDFLAPEVSVPAVRLGNTVADNVDGILAAKETLADAISAQVVSLLQPSRPDNDARQRRAAEALNQELRINLAEAYAIETIVQYGVSVKNDLPDDGDFPVRLAGQPTLISARDATTQAEITDLSTLDFTLSPAKVSLEETTYLTFFFNTQNPEKYEDIELNLTFNRNELEYNIKTVRGIAGYQSSDWLSFIEPDEPDTLGHVQIPIPLRTYPIPPSLVLQQAELDPDAIGNELAKVREWQYVYTYEHLDVAQDSLESDVRYNLQGLPSPAQLGLPEDSSEETLFDALVRFNQKYPALKATFDQLAEADTSAKLTALAEETTQAVDDFTKLVGQVAVTWREWQPVQRSIVATGVDYTINEEEPPVPVGQPAIKEMTIVAPDAALLPQVLLPGYRQLDDSPQRQDSAPGFQKQLYRFEEKSPEEAALDPVYGESSIPDRTLIIQDRDILAQQNAWSGIWLTRNRQLVPYAQTNPVFVFQTPQVRFSNWVTPLLVNNRPWNIADLSDTPEQPVLTHLQRLFETVLPDSAPQPYGLRLDCRYSFAMATVGDEQLLSAVPVLLTPRVAIARNTTITSQLVTDLATEIERWRQDNRPVEDQGRYQFTLNLFSGIDDDATLPLLKIENLYVQQIDIQWPSP